MGQKVHPHGLRVGVIKEWDAKWYANKKDFADNLVEDNKIREYVKKELFSAGISKIEIERAAKRIKLNIHTAKPGVVIGKGGAGIEALKQKINKLIGGNRCSINGRKYCCSIRKENLIQKSYEANNSKSYETRSKGC